MTFSKKHIFIRNGEIHKHINKMKTTTTYQYTTGKPQGQGKQGYVGQVMSETQLG